MACPWVHEVITGIIKIAVMFTKEGAVVILVVVVVVVGVGMVVTVVLLI